MENQKREVLVYETEDGFRPYEKWFNGLRDRRGQIAIDKRLTRVQSDCLEGQVSAAHGACHMVPVLTIALRITTNLCMHAVKATFFAFPLLNKRS
jgi:hypothetical protein